MRLSVLVALLATFAGGKSTSTAVAASSDEPADAKAVLKQLAAFYRQKKSFEVDFNEKVSIGVINAKETTEFQAKITAQRPNRLAVQKKGEQAGVYVACDGEQLSVSFPPFKKYTQGPAPKSLDELLTNGMIAGGFMVGRGPLWEVFTDDPYKTLMDDVTKDEYIGREKIGDTEAHHLKFEQNQFNWELWVAAGAQPLLLQAAFDLKKSFKPRRLDDEQFKKLDFSLVQIYKNWRFDKPPAPDAFAFRPPEGAKNLDDLITGGKRFESEASSLVGKPAPEVDQELLDGGHLSLKEQRGKKIVILYFWGTWCKPCLEQMPLVAKVADEYREKGVVLYSVNCRGESRETREFLKEKDLSVAALDSEEKASQAYRMRVIPTLVLIDKAGVVQSVHVGFGPDIVDKLKKELDAVLAGKDLAAETKIDGQAPDTTRGQPD